MRRAVCVFVLLVLASFPSKSLATILSPSALDLSATAGQQSTVDFTVANGQSEDVAVDLRVVKTDFRADDAFPVFSELSSDELSWFSLAEQNVSLQAFESREERLTINFPSGIDSGVRTYAVLAQERSKATSGVQLAPSTAALLFITLGSPKDALGSCESFSVDSDSGVYSVVLQNSGSGILATQEVIAARNMFGIVVAQAMMSEHRVLPRQSRTFHGSLPAMPWWHFGPTTWSADSCSSVKTMTLPSLWVIGGVIIVGLGGMVVVARRIRRA